MPKEFKNFLDIESSIFGKVKFYYYIKTVNNSKLLRYKIGEVPQNFDIVYSELENMNITLHEYFNRVLKFLSLQLDEVGDDDEFLNDMDVSDKELFEYLKRLKNESRNG